MSNLRRNRNTKQHNEGCSPMVFKGGIKKLFAKESLRFMVCQDAKSLKKQKPDVYCKVRNEQLSNILERDMAREIGNEAYKTRNTIFTYKYDLGQLSIKYDVCPVDDGQQQPFA